MKTESLLRALAADAARPVMPLRRQIAGAFSVGAALSVALFLLTLRPRPDLADALLTPAFCLKLAAVAGLALTSSLILSAVSTPLPRNARLWTLLFVPLLVVSGIGFELALVPSELWMRRLIGRNAAHCVALVPLLAAAPAACLMMALRSSAPARPAVAGAIVGLTAGGIGAALYALTCPDDSPLFVACWYSLAIAVVTGLSSIAGRRVLRW